MRGYLESWLCHSRRCSCWSLRARQAALRNQEHSSSRVHRTRRIWIRHSCPTASRSGSPSNLRGPRDPQARDGRRSSRGWPVKWKLTGGKTWTFWLRQGVKFHDGTPWNAAARLFTHSTAGTTGPARSRIRRRRSTTRRRTAASRTTRSRTCRPALSRAARRSASPRSSSS